MDKFKVKLLIEDLRKQQSTNHEVLEVLAKLKDTKHLISFSQRVELNHVLPYAMGPRRMEAISDRCRMLFPWTKTGGRT